MCVYNVYLLDDNAEFLSDFKETLEKHLRTLPYSFSLYSFTNWSDFEKSAAVVSPDLIISDINLSDESQTGISFLHDLRLKGCTAEVIFLTDYLTYATDIFEIHPLYFILKSEYKQRIPTAIDQFIQKMQARQEMLKLDVGSSTELIPADSIIYCEHYLRTTTIYCTDREISVKEPLANIAQSLPQKSFVFSHQSILINLAFVQRFNNTDVILTTRTSLPISRSHAKEFREAMANFLG